MKTEQEFLYRNVEIRIIKRFGFAYYFKYAGEEYFPSGDYIDSDNCRSDAKLHVDKILLKRGIGDNLEIGV